LERLHLFLRFAFGGSGFPVHAHGYDPHGRISWARFDVDPPLPVSGGHRRTTSWLPHFEVTNVADEKSAAEALNTALSAMFETWLVRCREDTKGRFKICISRAVDWYVAALNAFGKPECIVLAQASLEVLSMLYLTDWLRLSEKGRRGLDVADQLAVVLASLKISADIPDKLSHLVAYRKGTGKAGTGPIAVTEARNSAVHPLIDRDIPNQARAAEEQSLALWYVEMILLRLLDYRGAYWDRIEERNTSM
jgi:hypothetical protein